VSINFFRAASPLLPLPESVPGGAIAGYSKKCSILLCVWVGARQIEDEQALKSYKQFCPVAKAAEVFCERWTPLILRNLGLGVSRFAKLQGGIPQASPTILARRLKQLEAEGVVERRRSETGRSWTYHLTPAGEEFLPIVAALGAWGQRWSRRELQEHELNVGLLVWAMERGATHDAFGDRRTVIKLSFLDRSPGRRNYWFVIEGGKTELCVDEPGFGVDLYLTTSLPVMIRIWRGDMALTGAINDGQLDVHGPVWARRCLSRWLARSTYARIKPVPSAH
jgi:DNA-binding HxlR family transcriptional regulator